MTLSVTINESLKWLSSLPISVREWFWWWQCSDRYNVTFLPLPPPPYPPPPSPNPFSPSLASLMVSADVKHHMYLLKVSVSFRFAQGFSKCTRKVTYSGSKLGPVPPELPLVWSKAGPVSGVLVVPLCLIQFLLSELPVTWVHWQRPCSKSQFRFWPWPTGTSFGKKHRQRLTRSHKS